jgi:hypothetical protein
MTPELFDAFQSLVTKDILVVFETTLGLIFLDFLLGIILSVSKGDFDPRKLPQFLQKNILPYAGSVVLLGAFSLFLSEIKVLFFSATAAVGAKFLFEIKDKVRLLTGAKDLDK